jgi:preprotein translocase subunit YajC
MKTIYALTLALTWTPLLLAQGAEPPQGSPWGSFLPMMVIMFAIIYFLMIRPEQKKQKKRQQMLSELKKGDRVVTAGGIHGTVGNVKESSIMVKVAENVVMEFAKASVTSVLNKDGTQKDVQSGRIEKR